MSGQSQEDEWIIKFMNKLLPGLPEDVRKELEKCDYVGEGGAGDQEPQTDSFVERRRKFWDSDFVKVLKDLRCKRGANQVLPIPMEFTEVTLFESDDDDESGLSSPPLSPEKTAEDVLSIVMQHLPNLNAATVLSMTVVNKRTHDSCEVFLDSQLKKLIKDANEEDTNPDAQSLTLAQRFIGHWFLDRIKSLVRHVNELNLESFKYRFSIIIEEPVRHRHFLIEYSDSRIIVFLPTGDVVGPVPTNANDARERQRIKSYIPFGDPDVNPQYKVRFHNYMKGVIEPLRLTNAQNKNYINPDLLDFNVWTCDDMLNAVLSRCKCRIHGYVPHDKLRKLAYILKMKALNRTLPDIFRSPSTHIGFISRLERLNEEHIRLPPLPTIIPEDELAPEEVEELNFGTEFPLLEADRTNPQGLIDGQLAGMIMQLKNRFKSTNTGMLMKIWNAVSLELTKCPVERRQTYRNFLMEYLTCPKGLLIPMKNFRLTIEAIQRHNELLIKTKGKKGNIDADATFIVSSYFDTNYHVINVRDNLQSLVVRYVFVRGSDLKHWKLVDAFSVSPIFINYKGNRVNQNNEILTITTYINNSPSQTINILRDDSDDKYGVQLRINDKPYTPTGEHDYDLNDTIMMTIFESSRVLQSMDSQLEYDGYVFYNQSPDMADMFFNDIYVPGWQDIGSPPTNKEWDDVQEDISLHKWFNYRIKMNPYSEEYNKALESQKTGGIKKSRYWKNRANLS